MIWWARLVVFGPLVVSFVVLTALFAAQVVEWIVPRIMDRQR